MSTTALFSYSTLMKIAHLAVWTKKYARERDVLARKDWESTLQSKGCKSEECTGYICAKWFLHAHTHTHARARTHTCMRAHHVHVRVRVRVRVRSLRLSISRLRALSALIYVSSFTHTSRMMLLA